VKGYSLSLFRERVRVRVFVNTFPLTPAPLPEGERE